MNIEEKLALLDSESKQLLCNRSVSNIGFWDYSQLLQLKEAIDNELKTKLPKIEVAVIQKPTIRETKVDNLTVRTRKRK